MSHFNIIQLCVVKPTKEEYINESDIYEDPLFNSETDYGGDTLSTEERKKAIEYIKKTLEPYAKVDVQKSTIQFREKKIVKENWLSDVKHAYETFKKDLKEDHAFSLAEYKLRSSISEICSEDLFHNGYCMKFAAVIADYLGGYLPETVYIGAILDAHC